MQDRTTKIKNIWLLNHHAETPRTGTGTRHYDFARELIKRGYKVSIFASSHIHYTEIDILSENEKYAINNEAGIEWVWIKTTTYTSNGIRRIIGMIEYYFKVLYISKQLDKPDVVIGSAVHLLACLAAYKISKRYKIKFISEIRDLWPETLIQMGRIKRSSLLAKVMNFLEDYIYNKSNHIIVTAPGMMEYIEGRGIESTKIQYINNGIDTHIFDQRLKEQYSEDSDCALNKQRFNVVYTGGHGLANDLGTAVKAAGLIKEKGYDNILFSFYGEGPLKKELIEEAQELGVQNIKFKGFVPKYCIPKILVNADVLIVMLKDLELYKYGMSMNKIFEYLYSGTPIIFAVNVPNDYIKQTGDGYSIEPENPQQMADAIIKLYNSSQDKISEMGNKGKAFVKENFDIPVLVDKLESIINQ